METKTVYCSACDRDVSIVITDDPSHDGHANLHDAEVVCLEIGHECTGNLCPVGAAPPTVMAARLVRNGLLAAMEPGIVTRCASCGANAPHMIVDRTYMTCSECGATAERPVAR
jgi:DNA-directed RNA polymerase subunit RPC12/RpoP